MKIKEVTMTTMDNLPQATSPTPGTRHTEFSVEDKSLYPNTGPTKNQEEGWRVKTKGSRQDQEDKTTQQRPTADLPVN